MQPHTIKENSELPLNSISYQHQNKREPTMLTLERREEETIILETSDDQIKVLVSKANMERLSSRLTRPRK